MARHVAEQGQAIYEEKEERLEAEYGGGVVAIDVETGEVVAHAESLVAAAEAVDRNGDRIYFAAVGNPCAAKLV